MSHQMVMSFHHFWAFYLFLFLLAFVLYKTKKTKAANIVRVILRFVFFIMLASGVILLSMMGYPPLYILKGTLSVVLMFVMETILRREVRGTSDGKMTALYWILCVALALVVILIAFKVIPF